MPIVKSDPAPFFAAQQIPQIAALATSAWPAWLWSADGSRLIWANAVGAAIFGIENAAEVGKAVFQAGDSLAAEIAELTATLPVSGEKRLQRLAGLGPDCGGVLMCACSRLALVDANETVLIVAMESAGPSLSLRGRVRRLFADDGAAVAAFTPDGTLLHANVAALNWLGGSTTLSALGLDALAARAFEAGRANGGACLNNTEIEVGAASLGKDESHVLVLMLPPQGAAIAGAGDGPADEPAPTPSLSATTDAPISAETGSQPDTRTERRHPLRFVWHMDADGRFAVGSEEFTELVGPRTVAACGRLWSEIAAELKLDPDNQIARAIATRETWSGIPILWPVDDTSERLLVELSGLPVFDRDRTFGGYRGFGVCRDVVRINQLTHARRASPIGFSAASQRSVTLPTASAPLAVELIGQAAPATEPVSSPSRSAAAANVVPFRAGASPAARPPTLSPVERNAFRELAHELASRLRATHPEGALASPDLHGVSEAAGAAARLAVDVPALASDAQGCPQPQDPTGSEHLLLDRVPAGVLVYRNGLLLYANRHFLELTGYDNVEELAAAGGLDVLFAEPSTGSFTDNAGAQALSITTRAGERVRLEGRLLTVPWNGNSALALILTNGETDGRQRNAQLAIETAKMEIGNLKSDLKRTARREAQKAAASKADFLAKVSHEIRTPLNSIIGFAEVILAERFGSIGNERYREYLRDMHTAGTHLVSVLNDLLDLSKIETGQLDLNFADIDLGHLTQQCVDIMQPQANRARIIIRTALASGLPPAVADARSVRQIVLNLLANAIKLTGPGGQVIVSTATADSGEVLLRVRDTGVGMQEAELEKVLVPFQQSANLATWGSGGSGLGLPLSRALAEANRATFSIKSAPNAGTLVEIAFPSNRAATR